ncbi:MAG: AAA family ATPase [Nitriliruptoraceae bacterium]
MSHVVVHSTDPATETGLREVLGDDATVERVAASEEVEARGRAADVLLIGGDVELDDALGIAEVFDRLHPEVSVVLFAEPSTPTLSAALRVGVRDVIGPDTDPGHVRDAVIRALEAARARRRALQEEETSPRPRGRIITVASPKGGCGKTTIATNLAVEFGHRVPGEVVIVDLDLQFGDVATSLRLEHEHDVVDAIAALGADDLVLKSYLVSHASGCWALCAPTSPAAGEGVTGQQVNDLLLRLAAGFRYVIVDTAPGLAEYTLAALEVSTHPVLLAGMDVPSVRGLRRELGVLEELDLLAAERRIVLNMVDRRSGLTIEDVEGLLGSTIDVELPRSREVPLSTNRGVPLLDESTRDPVARNLRALADLLDARHPSSRAKRTSRRDRGAHGASTAGAQDGRAHPEVST